MPDALKHLPDSAIVTRLSGSTQSGCDAAVAAHAQLGAGGPTLAPAASAFGSITAGASIDSPRLGETIGRSLRSVVSALPAGALEQVEGIEREFSGMLDAVGGNPLLSVLPEGSALQDVVRQIIDEAVGLFEQRVRELAENLLGKDEVGALLDGFALIEGLASDYPAHAAELSAFLRSTLLGFDPLVLGPLRAQVDGTASLVAKLDADALAALTAGPSAALSCALAAVSDAVQHLDPAVADGYSRLSTALKAAASSADALDHALAPLFGALTDAAAGHAWDQVVGGYVRLLASLELTPRDLMDDVQTATVDLIDELVTAVEAATSPDAIAAGVTKLGADVHAAVSGSGIGQARAQVVDFLHGIRDTIAAVPLADAHRSVQDMLGRVGQELHDLGLDDLASGIEKGFATLSDDAAAAARKAAGLVGQALQDLLDAVDQLPTGQLAAELHQAVAQLGRAIDNLHDDATGLIDDLKAQLDALNGISYEPAANQVLAEINELRDRLRAINLDALSQESKLALKAALAVLEALDVEGRVVRGLGSLYHDLDRELRTVLDRIAAALGRIRQSVGELHPDALLAPVTSALSKVRAAVDDLDAGQLTTFLRTELDALDDWLKSLRPGRFLAPLQAPYDAGVAALHRLDPQDWGAGLADLHTRLAAVVDRLDLGPLFAELTQRREDLVELVRDTIRHAVEDAGLPAPLDYWFDRVLPVLTGVSDLLTLDAGAAMRELSDRVHEGLSPTAVFEALQLVFEAAAAALQAVPAADLVASATEVRDDVVAVLDELDPGRLVVRLRAAHGRLAELSPAALLDPLAGLTALRAAFHARVDVAVGAPAGQVATVDADFDVALGLVAPQAAGSLVHALTTQQDAALAALRSGIDTVAADPGLAQARQSFDGLRQRVESLVPPQLPRTGTIDADAVSAAFEHWRPAQRAATLQARVTAFLAALTPAAQALEGALDTFTADLRAAGELIDPLALDSVVAEVFDAVRAQVDALDPTDLLDTLREDAYIPVVTAVQALDPAALATRLELAYDSARTDVMREMSGLVQQVTSALTQHLAAVKQSVDRMLNDVAEALGKGASDLQDVIRQAADLVLVELVDRLRTVLDTLATSFDHELLRIKKAFDEMLDAASLGERIHPRTAGGTG